MAWQHGKDTYVSVDGDDISAFTNTSELEDDTDEHDVSCYGVDDHEVQGGLGLGKFTCGGVYWIGATGPGAVLRPLRGTVVPVVRRPEGTGTTLPQQAFDALLKKYVETSPVADMVTWSAEFTKSGPIDRTAQA